MMELDEMNNTIKKIYTLNGEYYHYPEEEK
jgi:hypothetical protein